MLPGLRTTHDWSTFVDQSHMERVRRELAELTDRSVTHLLLEVLAYALDEAAAGTTSRVWITCTDDGAWSVVDDGRGTDTRLDVRGVPVVKPVMATADLRFFDADDAPLLVDGRPRRGMSVVTGSSSWLVHENRRLDGAWTSRYEDGLPVGDPAAIEPDGTTGTSVTFRPGPDLVETDVDLVELRRLVDKAVATSAAPDTPVNWSPS